MGEQSLPKLDDDRVVSSRRVPPPEELEQEAAERVGAVLASKYQLDAVLGSGGMAHVYRATNVGIGRTVAIKVLRSDHAKSSEIVERFLREARTANLVRHPNVVDVLDVAQDEGGLPFIVLEYLEGETLYEHTYRRGRLDIDEMLEIMGPVLSAVAEAHANGVVHRDLKPENVFLAKRRGRRTPKVLDFGISKVRGADMTVAGTLLGTPAYMAPETVYASKDADPRSDVWALGVMIFEMLSGVTPFEGDNPGQIFAAIATTDAAKLSDVRPGTPPGISRVVERCLKRDPGSRYASAAALALDLATAVEAIRPGAAAGWSLLPDPIRSAAKTAALGGLGEEPPSSGGVVPIAPVSLAIPRPAPVPEPNGRPSERALRAGFAPASSRSPVGGSARPHTARSARAPAHGRSQERGRSPSKPRLAAGGGLLRSWRRALADLSMGDALVLAGLVLFVAAGVLVAARLLD